MVQLKGRLLVYTNSSHNSMTNFKWRPRSTSQKCSH